NLKAMAWDGLRFSRMELSGSLGDIGTMLPLLIPLILVNGLNATTVFLMVGLFYIFTGIYYRIPVPVQPLKAVAVIAISTGLSARVVASSGIIMGTFLLCLALTGLIKEVARVFSKPVVRGIQVTLGLMLFIKGFQYMSGESMFIGGEKIFFEWFPLNPLIALCGLLIAGCLLTSRKIPAALLLVLVGLGIGMVFKPPELSLGPTVPVPVLPNLSELQMAFLLLVLPQIPVTIGNAIISTSDLAKKYFGKRARRASTSALASTIGVANLASGLVGGMPMCHGAGGLAAHYRFGARSGGANLMIGSLFLIAGLVFGSSALSVLGAIPLSILGVMLAITGVQLIVLLQDLSAPRDLAVAGIIIGITLATNQMAAGFIIGIIVHYLMVRWPWSEW
ncbi:MAG: putative sulfate/molybdate transporter, partial [Candidatus Hadarchaeales archaeon]